MIDLLMTQPYWLVVSGAGVSAASGVPTYRNRRGQWQRKPPVTHQEFIASADRRRRFWARNMIGWRFISEAQPNAAHRALVQLEARGAINALITQNVDRLHQRAGSREVVDLHGRVDRVSCLNCGESQSRASLQAWFEQHNPKFAKLGGRIAPDGDADIDDLDYADLAVPDCRYCGGLLKPDAVFFGASIPPQRVALCEQLLERAPGLLVIGSSLQTYSGYRLCLSAERQHKPIALLCDGVTRADHIATQKVSADCLPVLQGWLERLAERGD